MHRLLVHILNLDLLELYPHALFAPNQRLGNVVSAVEAAIAAKPAKKRHPCYTVSSVESVRWRPRTCCIQADILPDDGDTLRDFGFLNLASSDDRCNLLGLYEGLFLCGVTPEQLHEWQVEGSLVKNIRNVFYNIPPVDRGEYFPWFFKRTYILDGDGTVPSDQEVRAKMTAMMCEKARSYLDAEDRLKEPTELKPSAKQRCFHFVAMICHTPRPHPTDEAWDDFGFAICLSEHEETNLARLYWRLLFGNARGVNSSTAGHDNQSPPTATFTEFWQAFESHTIDQLMDSKGLVRQRSHFNHHAAFFRPPNDLRPSIWSLMQFLRLNDPAKYPPNAAVEADYGFMNCRTFAETCILTGIYRKLLGIDVADLSYFPLSIGPREAVADPVKMHYEGCVKGKLFEFLSGIQWVSKEHRRLMKNFYPLKPMEDEV
ncbi:hypothetical protein AJ79_01768 [Helicocarpus griseus UAMH5409]|uniref:Uncharacterized protein n=1 Tax=Helicocarpus griseus UAMH5409 TaxID=1447875 RepID=A0A2B7Y753_9EURO|nr:hypothetical protein AJ79_01768 [Helicocarpus griseus UAMH5409]